MAKPFLRLLPFWFLLFLPSETPFSSFFHERLMTPAFPLQGLVVLAGATAVEDNVVAKYKNSSLQHTHMHTHERSSEAYSSCKGCDGRRQAAELDSLVSVEASSAHTFHNVKALAMEEVKGSDQHLHPQTFFEVSAPLDPPPHSPCASLQVFSHSFANSYGLPPAMADYTPPSEHECNNPSHWTLVVLTWSGSSVGRQFDRIAAVWFGGVEFLRTCTAEPSKQGIVWEVKKDVTKYESVLAKPQTIRVELENLVTDKLTGVFNITLTLDFFSGHSKSTDPPADLVLPLSSQSPLPNGHWFHITNDSYVPSKSFSVPANVHKAVLEVYVSFHGDDESWYTNPSNEYIRSNNLTGVAGNGPFREVQARLDSHLVAAIWPFPVVYTGGIINLYWRPAAAIGAFDLPTFEFDLTPFVGSLVNGEQHSVDFRVENAVGEWLIDGSLHLWLDENATQTSGKLVSYSAPSYSISSRSDFTGLNGSLHTTASRTLSYSGVVLSSAGNRSVSSSYALEYKNIQIYSNNSALQTTSQTIDTKGKIKVEAPSKVVILQDSFYTFPLDLSCLYYEGANSSLVFNCNFSHAFNKQISIFTNAGSSFSLLNNSQQGQGEIVVVDSTVVAGLGALQHQYHAESSYGCYKRDIRTWNSTLLYDDSSKLCSVLV
ncbi:hypothetical protein GOP47_0015040 [Adiantum capillus-veneris]|uniref:Peptide N-acetyl-beta-D-glucosaminyl asparaginase amidase A N-terminal domain-containing protein n=1 Tax=Adiantum capillus-veneris TaxID=13818 RepID=A0A9D4UN51_ADICA|nr:hypothetical protein GOP47_0015040 [Adiantum capillus-veneris]